MKSFVWTFLAIFLLVLVGCYTVPETGRKSLALAPDSLILPQSKAAFDKLKGDSELSEDPGMNARVREITDRIVLASGAGTALPPVGEWDVAVFQDDEMLNAFAMPGGKVGVYTGLINLTDSDDELAVVIAHEIAHVAAQHGRERVSQGLLTALGGAAVVVATKDQEDSERNKWLALYGGAAQFGVILPYSRDHESEADYIGLLYMARAGYDPRSAISFWQKMAAKGGGKQPPEFMSTHPSHDTRIRKLNEAMPKAELEYLKYKNQ